MVYLLSTDCKLQITFEIVDQRKSLSFTDATDSITKMANEGTLHRGATISFATAP